MNARYSLRAFARDIGLAPSKTSEILAGKKGLGEARAESVADRLRLGAELRAIFVDSVVARHARTPARRALAAARLRARSPAKATPREGRSAQRNAWYFGAVRALKAAGFTDERRMAERLGLTALQVENALRYLRRLRAGVTPSYEAASLIKRFESAYLAETELDSDAQFWGLNPGDARAFDSRWRELVEEFRVRARDGNGALHMVVHARWPLARFGKEEGC